MDKFPEKYNLSRLTDEEIENLNRWVTSKEIKSVIKPLSKQESRTRWLHWWILPNIQRFNTSLILLQKIKEEGLLSNSLYQAKITLILKPVKDITKRKLQADIPDEHRCKKVLNKLLANWIEQFIKRIIHHVQVGFIPQMQG